MNSCCTLTANPSVFGEIYRGETTDRGVLGLSSKNMSLFISSFILAIAFCAPPGVITAETVRAGAAAALSCPVRPVWIAGRGYHLGYHRADGLAFIIQNNTAKIMLSLVGILLMLKLAWDAIQDARYGKELDITVSPSRRGDFANGAFLSLGNPMNIVFWTGLGTTVFASLSGQPQPVDLRFSFPAF